MQLVNVRAPCLCSCCPSAFGPVLTSAVCSVQRRTSSMPELTSTACAWLAQRRPSALLRMAWSSAQAVTALPSSAQTRWALLCRQPLGLSAGPGAALCAGVPCPLWQPLLLCHLHTGIRRRCVAAGEGVGGQSALFSRRRHHQSWSQGVHSVRAC